MHESISAQRQYMFRALDLARMHNPAPNPAVGAVIVKDGRIVAEAAHCKVGEEHAEAAAIRLAGKNAAGATLYVTLEPCCHSGGEKRRPPCTKAVIESGIGRVVAASEDPNPKVSGRGFRELRAAGIEVSHGLLSENESEMNRAYRRYQKTGLPWIHLKQAVSLDGFISKNDAGRTILSCRESLMRVHTLRAAHQAVLVGGETVIKDRPRLTLRYGLEATGSNPARIVIEGGRAIAEDNPVFDSETAPVYLFSGSKDSNRLDSIASTGTVVIRTEGRPEPAEVFRHCGSLGIISILAEAGGRLSSALLGANLVDEISLFYSPQLLGEGIAMSSSGGFRLDESRWKPSEPELLGRDILLNWIRRDEAGRCSPD